MSAGARPATTVRACALVDVGRFQVCDLPAPEPGAHDVLVEPAAVGLCGTDFHIYSGESNFVEDEDGRPVPLSRSPQVLGHEITGTVRERGEGVRDLDVGDRVVLDQGRSCRGERREPPCEYCATGNSHQCASYREHGITGLPGGLCERLVLPALNAVRIESALPADEAALTEPLACVLHALDAARGARTRYRFQAAEPRDRVRAVLVLGAGPAGLLFLQALRAVLGFDGVILVCDRSPEKRRLAAELGAEVLLPEELVPGTLEHTGGRRVECLVEATGAGSIFAEIPALIRKQATVLLYGIGHGGASLELLNPLQWKEPALVASIGASGGFDPDGRPEIYRRALRALEQGSVRAAPLITHRYRGLAEVPRAFAGDHARPEYVKGVALLS